MKDGWNQASAYDRFMGRWSRQIARRFVEWLDVPAGAAWLDVGCGTGALLETILGTSSPGRLAGVDRSEAFVAAARERLPAGTDLKVADAERLPFGPELSFDASVSGLVLNFVAHPAAAVAEMRRVTLSGGVVAVYV